MSPGGLQSLLFFRLSSCACFGVKYYLYASSLCLAFVVLCFCNRPSLPTRGNMSMLATGIYRGNTFILLLARVAGEAYEWRWRSAF